MGSACGGVFVIAAFLLRLFGYTNCVIGIYNNLQRNRMKRPDSGDQDEESRDAQNTSGNTLEERARDYALKLLARRQYSVAKLREKIMAKFASSAAAEKTLAFCAEARLTDDEKFCLVQAEHMVENKPLSKALLHQKLAARGFSSAHIRRAMDELQSRYEVEGPLAGMIGGANFAMVLEFYGVQKPQLLWSALALCACYIMQHRDAEQDAEAIIKRLQMRGHETYAPRAALKVKGE